MKFSDVVYYLNCIFMLKNFIQIYCFLSLVISLPLHLKGTMIKPGRPPDLYFAFLCIFFALREVFFGIILKNRLSVLLFPSLNSP